MGCVGASWTQKGIGLIKDDIQSGDYDFVFKGQGNGTSRCSARCDKNMMKVKGFMWCMQKAMAHSHVLERVVKRYGRACWIGIGPLGLQLGPAEGTEDTKLLREKFEAIGRRRERFSIHNIVEFIPYQQIGKDGSNMEDDGEFCEEENERKKCRWWMLKMSNSESDKVQMEGSSVLGSRLSEKLDHSPIKKRRIAKPEASWPPVASLTVFNLRQSGDADTKVEKEKVVNECKKTSEDEDTSKRALVDRHVCSDAMKSREALATVKLEPNSVTLPDMFAKETDSYMVRQRQRRRAGVSRTRASEGESNSIQNGSTINCDTNETSPANVTDYVTDNLRNPSLQEGRKPVWVSKGLLQRYSKKELMRQGTLGQKGLNLQKLLLWRIKKHFVWDLEIETNAREAWDSKASSRYTDFLRDIRDKNVKLVCMSDDAWRNFTSYWGTPKYKEIQENDTQNRLKGKGSSTHTGGSISFREHAKNLDNVLHLRKEREENPASAISVDETKLYIAATSDAKKRNLRFNITLPDYDYDSENGNGGDARQGPNTSHSGAAVRRDEDDLDSRMIGIRTSFVDPRYGELSWHPANFHGPPGYDVLVFKSSWLLVKLRHIYAISSYWIRCIGRQNSRLHDFFV
ncbi:PDR ABC-type transporter family protein [Tanacetum coccineum]|uniref:PDR ABC-type transporter family protein n=1 Tax=Tanacetum coccineum TaxID=301880 RepID=A0ABQ5C3Z0_9ASTR